MPSTTDDETLDENTAPEIDRTPSRAHGVIVDGRYEVGRRLGAGGMGTVYQATYLTLGYEVALKLSSSGSKRAEERMLRQQDGGAVCALGASGDEGGVAWRCAGTRARRSCRWGRPSDLG